MRPALSPEQLLNRLLALHWLGGVTDEDAAKLVGIRKADFAEYADVRLLEHGLRRAALAYFRRAFHRQFPECDARAWQRAKHATAKRKPGTYSRKPSRREVELMTPPQRFTERELVPRPAAPDAEVARYLAAHPIPLHRRFRDPPQSGTETEVAQVKYG